MTASPSSLPRPTPAGASAAAKAAQLARAERPALIAKSAAAGAVLGIACGALLGWGPGVLAGSVTAGIVGMVLRRRSDAFRWRLGARGERRTARLLNPLQKRGFAVLHDLSIPGSRANLDHLVIGPTGVVLVDSKVRRGTVRVGPHGWIRIGRTGGPLLVKSAAWEARQVSDGLSAALGRRMPVRTVLAMHSAAFPLWRTLEVQGVAILPAAAVTDWIMQGPALLSSGEVSVIANAALKQFPRYLR